MHTASGIKRVSEARQLNGQQPETQQLEVRRLETEPLRASTGWVPAPSIGSRAQSWAGEKRAAIRSTSTHVGADSYRRSRSVASFHGVTPELPRRNHRHQDAIGLSDYFKTAIAPVQRSPLTDDQRETKPAANNPAAGDLEWLLRGVKSLTPLEASHDSDWGYFADACDTHTTELEEDSMLEVRDAQDRLGRFNTHDTTVESGDASLPSSDSFVDSTNAATQTAGYTYYCTIL